MEMTLGSLFDGAGGFPLAGTMAGITPKWASEIEPFPIRVTTRRLPGMRHIGDITGIDGGEVFALFLPFFYWIISDMVKDMLDIFTGDPEVEADGMKGSGRGWHTSKHGTDAHAARLTIPREKPTDAQSDTSAKNAGQSAREGKLSGSGTTQHLAPCTAQSGHCRKPT